EVLAKGPAKGRARGLVFTNSWLPATNVFSDREPESTWTLVWKPFVVRAPVQELVPPMLRRAPVPTRAVRAAVTGPFTRPDPFRVRTSPGPFSRVATAAWVTVICGMWRLASGEPVNATT